MTSRDEDRDLAFEKYTMSGDERNRMKETVERACTAIARLWPMKTFAYRNPLQGWEQVPFHEGIAQASRLIGGKGYLSNEDYRQLRRDGSITDDAIRESLHRVGRGITNESLAVGERSVTAEEVLRLHLVYGLEKLEPGLVTWQLNGGLGVEKLRDDLPAKPDMEKGQEAKYVRRLWESTQAAVIGSKESASASNHALEPRAGLTSDLPRDRTLSDWIESSEGTSLVKPINDQMIKWTSAFVDEGMASWEMPSRHDGFFQTWRALALRDFSGYFHHIRSFSRKIRQLPREPEDNIHLGLSRLGIPESRWQEYLSRMMAQLPGWVGFIRWRAENSSYPAQAKHAIDPLQYLAVRMFYEVEFVQSACRRRWGIDGNLPEIRSQLDRDANALENATHADAGTHGDDPNIVSNHRWRLFHLAQFLNFSPEDVSEFDGDTVDTLLSWLDQFPAEEHGAIWIDALETTYRHRLLEQLTAHEDPESASTGRKLAQLVFCIDARSESFRRHIEAQGPYDTYGFAGFFGVPISYHGFDVPGRLALCPVILSPQFAVDETPRSDEQKALTKYSTGSRWIELGDHLFHDLKRNPIGSLMLIDVLGLLFAVRLTGKTFLQKPYELLKSLVQRYLRWPVATEIPVNLEEYSEADSSLDIPHGFKPEEKAMMVEKGLRAMGLTRDFGRFVILCGHGSTADNNPYQAAYNCGACGGSDGDPNARVLARMGNDPQVRQTIKEHGLEIPDDTWFLAAKHNTTTDRVTFYDVEDIPKSHDEDFRQLVRDLEIAGDHQALERCQRIPRAPRNLSPDTAREHVIQRSMDWANVRPEWGLSGHAAFIIGRRALTRGLDLESRTFLHSYDPEADEDGAILEFLMTAPLVVVEWINMEYYFSAVDPWCYGSGSKVTHNVVSGVGVMTGSHGDLQTGLPLQGVNDGQRHYHQPMRILAVIEAPTQRIAAAVEKHELLQNLLHNQWINLVACDPVSREFHRYQLDATWEPCGVDAITARQSH